MKTWVIPIAWEMYGRCYVEADTLEDAIDIALGGDTPLPEEEEYVENSETLWSEDIDFIRSWFNDGQEDECGETVL